MLRTPTEHCILSEVYESIRLGGAERNAERLGLFVAWLVSNHLLDPVLEKSAGSAVARLRLQDLTGPEFLTTVLHGELMPAHLNEVGRGFVDDYFVSGTFNALFATSTYCGEDEWIRYKELSPGISAAFRRYKNPESSFPRPSAKIIRFPIGRRRS